MANEDGDVKLPKKHSDKASKPDKEESKTDTKPKEKKEAAVVDEPKAKKEKEAVVDPPKKKSKPEKEDKPKATRLDTELPVVIPTPPVAPVKEPIEESKTVEKIPQAVLPTIT